MLGTHQGTGSAPVTMWVRVYSVASGALLHSWSGLLNTTSGGYTTLAWTDRGRQLAIGYTFSVTPAGSKRSWPYIGVRLLDVNRRGHNLTTGSRLAWSKLAAEGGLSRPTPLTCAPDLQVVVSADGTVVCGGYGILRAYTPNPLAKTCPAVPDWASVGFVTYSTVTGKQAGTLFQYDTNCQPGNVGVLWTSAAGDRVIGYYSLGSILRDQAGLPVRRLQPRPVHAAAAPADDNDGSRHHRLVAPWPRRRAPGWGRPATRLG